MRTGFLLALLAASLFYTWVAFTELSFLSMTGRLGAGFFPRLIGVLLVVACAASLTLDRGRDRDGEALVSDRWGDVGAIVVLTGALVALLPVLGGTLASGAFLFAVLSVLDRGRPLRSLAIAVALPAAVYLLFRVVLNASMPDGMLPFSF